MASIPRKDIPAFVRRSWQAWKKASIHTRDAEIERLKFYVGGDLQWRDSEISKRREQGRPWITINKCKPAVDQIEGDVRLNPPGPQCLPVGDNPDAADPDIIEGLIREVEYRSMSEVADATAVKYSAITGYGVIELSTEYCNDRDDTQRLRIDSIEDPHTVFFDPNARMANRQDAKWAGKIKAYSRDQYIAAFGKDSKVLQPGGMQVARGWLADAFGSDADMSTIIEWTGARDGGDGRWKGPFYVCEFYLVEEEPRTSCKCSDGIWRFDDEVLPARVFRVTGRENSRESPKRKITKYLVDALEAKGETEWPGTLPPLFPVLGPEIYIDGKLHRLSLISPGMDSNRALNYFATTCAEVAGIAAKHGYVGYKGQFEDPRWQSINSEVWAYVEVTPKFATNEMGQQVLLPPPQKNQWEAPIQWLILGANFFTEQFKAVTGMYSSSLGEEKGDQSGKAIEQLRTESNVGNFSYADNLHRTKAIIYQQMCVIFPKIMTGPEVRAIVKPDSQHEMAAINQIFGADGIDPKTGKKGKRNSLALGEYSVRVVVGQMDKTRDEQASKIILDALHVNPQLAGNPAIMAKVLRWLGKGNPEIEGIADILAPSPDSDMTPAQMHQQLQMAQAQGQQQQQTIQKLSQALAAKIPEIESRERIESMKAAIDLAKAEMAAKTQTEARAAADRLAILEIAHDSGMQASDQVHEAQMAQMPPPVDPNAQPNQPEAAR